MKTILNFEKSYNLSPDTKGVANSSAFDPSSSTSSAANTSAVVLEANDYSTVGNKRFYNNGNGTSRSIRNRLYLEAATSTAADPSPTYGNVVGGHQSQQKNYHQHHKQQSSSQHQDYGDVLIQSEESEPSSFQLSSGNSSKTTTTRKNYQQSQQQQPPQIQATSSSSKSTKRKRETGRSFYNLTNFIGVYSSK